MIGDYPTQLDEIDQWLNDNFGILPGACSSTESLRYSVARRVAEALWPKTQSIPSDDDLEKYASRAGFDYVDDIEYKYPDHRWNDHDVEFAYRDGIIAGAEWQKAKMLEEAVEGYVNYYEDGGGKLMAEAQVGCPYHIGNKVKIVIVPIKED